MASNESKVIPDLSGFELGLMAAILSTMAARGTAAPTHKGSAKKIRALRAAIPQGLGKGAMEVVPREILQEDVIVAKKLVASIMRYPRSERDKESKIRSIVRAGHASIEFDHVAMDWPWPAGASETRCQFDSPMPPAKRAQFLVAKRYGIPPESVRRALAKPARGAKAPPGRDRELRPLLAWAFTDLCSVENLGRSHAKCRQSIFDVLMEMRYEPFVLYYRLQLAQSSGKVRAYTPEALIDTSILNRLVSLAQGDG